MAEQFHQGVDADVGVGQFGGERVAQPVDKCATLVTLSAGPAAAFLTEGRVALSAGPAFGRGGRGHVRLNFATNREILGEAVQRMGAVWKGHR